MYKEGDWVKLVSERPVGWNSDGHMDHYLGAIVFLTRVSFTHIYFEGKGRWSFEPSDIERLATAEEISQNLHKKYTKRDLEVMALLDKMHSLDRELYQSILNKNGFSYAFGLLVEMARESR